MWHDSCFCCTECNTRLISGKQLEHNDQPYCHTCYNNKYQVKGYGVGNGASLHSFVQSTQHNDIVKNNRHATEPIGKIGKINVNNNTQLKKCIKCHTEQTTGWQTSCNQCDTVY